MCCKVDSLLAPGDSLLLTPSDGPLAAHLSVSRNTSLLSSQEGFPFARNKYARIIILRLGWLLDLYKLKTERSQNYYISIRERSARALEMAAALEQSHL